MLATPRLPGMLAPGFTTQRNEGQAYADGPERVMADRAAQEPTRSLKAVDLFCGVGGLSKGLHDSGMEIVAAYDNWPAAVDAYTRNMPHAAERMDLMDIATAVREVSAHKPDIIVGGPPCQDFSTAGNRVEGDKASLTIAYASIVAECRPPFVLMENVPQARVSSAYHRMKGILEGHGYQIHESVLDASYCGVPQIRKRFFMFGWRGGVGIRERLAHWLGVGKSKEPLTVKDYLQDEIDVEYYYRHPRNYSRRAIFTVREPSPTIRGVNRPVPPNYHGNHLDSAPPSAVRPLFSRERSRIQTFPRSWVWSNDGADRKADVELLIGNAVPVNLAAFVGKGVLNAVD